MKQLIDMEAGKTIARGMHTAVIHESDRPAAGEHIKNGPKKDLMVSSVYRAVFLDLLINRAPVKDLL